MLFDYRFVSLVITNTCENRSKSYQRYQPAMKQFQQKALNCGITYYVFQQWRTLGSWSQW